MDRKDIMNNIPKSSKEDFNMSFSDNYMYFNTDSVDLKLSYYNILKIVDNDRGQYLELISKNISFRLYYNKTMYITLRR